MRHLITVLFAAVISIASLQVAHAQQQQQTDDNNNNTGNISGQTGQSDNFTIQRDTNAFIGGSTTSIFGGQATAGRTTGLGGLGTTGLFGGLGGLGRGGFGNNQFGNQANNQGETAPQIRFRITLGFSHPRPSGPKISARFARRLTRIPQLPSAAFVSVTMDERTAVLAGEVETAHEKRLIERLALMEPGVSEVRNELTVAAPPELLPPAEATN